MKNKKRENKSPKKRGGSISDFFTNMLFIILVVGIISFIIWLVYNNNNSNVSNVSNVSKGFFTSNTNTKNSVAYNILLKNDIPPCESLEKCWEKQYKNYTNIEKLKHTLVGNNVIINALQSALKSIGQVLFPQVQNKVGNQYQHPNYAQQQNYASQQNYAPQSMYTNTPHITNTNTSNTPIITEFW